MNQKLLKKQYIENVYQQKAFIISKTYFNLHHGGRSHLYLDHSKFLSCYKFLNLLVKNCLALMPQNLTNFQLGAVDSIMSPVICGLMAQKLKKDVIVVKEKKLAHGLENKIYGKLKSQVILIDDVTSTGSSLINAAKALRKMKVKVRYGIVSACRDLSAINNLSREKIKTFYIATYEEIIKTLWPMLKTWEKEVIFEEIKEKKYHWNLNIC